MPVKVPVDRSKMGKGWRLGEELKGQSMACVIRIQKIARECQQLAPILCDPILINGIELLHPLTDFGMLKTAGIRSDTDLAAAQLPRNMRHGW